MELSVIVWAAVAAILIFAFIARLLKEHHHTVHHAHLKPQHVVQNVEAKAGCRR